MSVCWTRLTWRRLEGGDRRRPGEGEGGRRDGGGLVIEGEGVHGLVTGGQDLVFFPRPFFVHSLVFFSSAIV